MIPVPMELVSVSVNAPTKIAMTVSVVRSLLRKLFPIAVEMMSLSFTRAPFGLQPARPA